MGLGVLDWSSDKFGTENINSHWQNWIIQKIECKELRDEV